MRLAFDFSPIRKEFGYSEAADRDSAAFLARRLAQAPYDGERVLRTLGVRGRTVHVLGAGDEARRSAEALPKGAELWSADGATTAALEAGRLPRMIVTDLDGRVEDQVQAAKDGSFVAVHAHGDNPKALARWLPEFPPGRVVGTCQVEPVGPLVNPGGFTDGDRAVFLALSLGASAVVLHAFDYERPGKYSGVKDAASKRLKLAWARRLVNGLIAGGAPVSHA